MQLVPRISEVNETDIADGKSARQTDREQDQGGQDSHNEKRDSEILAAQGI